MGGGGERGGGVRAPGGARDREGALPETVREYGASAWTRAGRWPPSARPTLLPGLATTAGPALRGAQQLAWLSHLEREHNCAPPLVRRSGRGRTGHRLATSLGCGSSGISAATTPRARRSLEAPCCRPRRAAPPHRAEPGTSPPTLALALLRTSAPTRPGPGRGPSLPRPTGGGGGALALARGPGQDQGDDEGGLTLYLESLAPRARWATSGGWP